MSADQHWLLAGLFLCAVALAMFIPTWRARLAAGRRVMAEAQAEIDDARAMGLDAGIAAFDAMGVTR